MDNHLKIFSVNATTLSNSINGSFGVPGADGDGTGLGDGDHNQLSLSSIHQQIASLVQLPRSIHTFSSATMSPNNNDGLRKPQKQNHDHLINDNPFHIDTNSGNNPPSLLSTSKFSYLPLRHTSLRRYFLFINQVYLPKSLFFLFDDFYIY